MPRATTRWCGCWRGRVLGEGAADSKAAHRATVRAAAKAGGYAARPADRERHHVAASPHRRYAVTPLLRDTDLLANIVIPESAPPFLLRHLGETVRRALALERLFRNDQLRVEQGGGEGGEHGEGRVSAEASFWTDW